jgi:hypothetical protein
MFGSKRKELTGGWRKWGFVRIANYGDQAKGMWWMEHVGRVGEMRNTHSILLEIFKRIGHFED